MFNLLRKRKKKEVIRATIQTLIGVDTSVEGDFVFSGGMHVVGTVIGNISSSDENSLLIVGDGAMIKGDVSVANIIVNGQVDGNVYVKERVELFDNACINGDVHYRTIELPAGAEVNGRLVREVDGLSSSRIAADPKQKAIGSSPKKVSSIHEGKKLR